MRIGLRLLAALAALALALPVLAAAQGAGDEQYQDPFGGGQGGKSPTVKEKPKPRRVKPRVSRPRKSQPTPATTTTTTPTTTAPPATTTTTATPPPRRHRARRLPRTVRALTGMGLVRTRAGVRRLEAGG